MLLLKASYEAHLEDRRWLQHYYNQEQTPSVVERYYAQLVKSEVWFTGMLLALSLQLAKWHSVPLEVSHPEIFGFQNVIKIKNNSTIFS